MIALASIAAADITGKWTASFDTQIGKQDYTSDFVVKGSKLTGKMKSNLGDSDVLDGKVDGDKVTFGELLKFEGMDVKITYSGTIVSADEIKVHAQRGGLRDRGAGREASQVGPYGRTRTYHMRTPMRSAGSSHENLDRLNRPA